MAMVSALETWCKEVKTAAHLALEQGAKVPGFKLVNKRALRVWSDQEAVEDKVRKAKKLKMADAFTLKLLSPPQLEKVCKEKGIPFKAYTEYITSHSSGTTLAPESDKRQAVTPAVIPENLLKLVSK